MELTTTEVLTLIFRDDESINNTPTYLAWIGEDLRPVKIARELGEALQKDDPEEELIHIDLYPTHAQVWRRWAWLESNEHRTRLRHGLQLAREISDNRAQVVETLVSKLSETTGVKRELCYRMAREIFDKRQYTLASILGVKLP